MSTAIFTNEIYANQLLLTELHLGPHGSDKVLRIARVFMAIQESMRWLRELYQDLRGVPRQPPPQTVALWPRPTGNPLESTERLPELEFFAKVDRADGTPLPHINERNENHATYLARMQIKTSIQTVFVKFATKYHEAAHRLLADRVPPLAPTLRFCSPVVDDRYGVHPRIDGSVC